MTHTAYIAGCLLLIVLMGCQTAQKKDTQAKQDQIVTALGTVTEGLTNQNISQQDLKNLAIQIEKDPQTKSAVSAVNQALNAHQTGVKYCPVDGQRFSASVSQCPVHKIQLKDVE